MSRLLAGARAKGLALSFLMALQGACAGARQDDAGEPDGAGSREGEESMGAEPGAQAPDAEQRANLHDGGGSDAVEEASTLDAEMSDAPHEPDAAAPIDAQAAAAGDSGSTRQITIRFKAEVSGQDFACGRDYEGQGKSGLRATPSDLRFFVHDVRLIAEQGEQVPLRLSTREPWQVPELALLDFEDAQGHCVAGNPGSNRELTGSVPAGDYRGLAFTLGVPSALNHADPALAPAPLRNAPGMLWSWALGYKFVVAGLDQVVAAGERGGLAAVHIGGAGCSGDVCVRPNRSAVRFANFDPELDAVVVDLGAVYAQTDLSAQAECHSFGPHCVAPFAALGLDYESGMPLAAHPALRVIRR